MESLGEHHCLPCKTRVTAVLLRTAAMRTFVLLFVLIGVALGKAPCPKTTCKQEACANEYKQAKEIKGKEQPWDSDFGSFCDFGSEGR